MSLNITYNGFHFDESGTKNTGDGKFQVLFFPNGTASSPTTWSDVRTVEVTGYWNINAGDLSWLGQDGIVLDDSKIVLVFWRGTTTDRNDNCTNLIEWGATELTNIGSSVYTLDTQTKSNIAPTLVWDFPGSGLVGTDYDSTNTSYDVHSWDFGGVTMNHWRTRYGENIQLVNTVDSTNYIWDDGDFDTGIPGAAIGTHQWTGSGLYNVGIEITDECSTVSSGTLPIEISWHSPVPNIICNEAVGDTISTPDTVVTFQYTGTDIDDKISSIDWVIEDVGAYGTTTTTINGAGRDDVISHTNGLGTDWFGNTASPGAFTNPGTHNVSIVIHWHDGFDDVVVNYNEDFEQSIFSGPTANFYQDPTQAATSSGVDFINTTSGTTSRVGTGLPNHIEYNWSYDDGGSVTNVTDKTKSYIFTTTPDTVSGTVTLDANWQDGWENQVDSVTKQVRFRTQVTIDEEDCYYTLSITGTSTDGTISGYHWEVYKDVSGVWELTWESPEGMDQNDKKVCFTSIGDYRIKGFIHGTGDTTSDYVDQTIDLVCPTEAFYYIWNGTGVDDTGGDWQHTGFGLEAAYAKESGTNGLDASGLKKNSRIKFNRIGPPINIDDYDLLVLSVYINEWPTGSDFELGFRNIGITNGNNVNLSDYIAEHRLGEWQKVHIPLTAFGLEGDDVHKFGFIDELRWQATGDMSLYFDNIMVGVGSIIRQVIAVEQPDIESHEIGEMMMQGFELKPSMKSIPESRKFPGPTNL